jgi:alkylated DNA repair protein alkB family protein 1
VGVPYDWARRTYPPDVAAHPPVPADIAAWAAALCARVARVLGPGPWPLPALRAEAGIVNLYRVGARMGGHRDDAEPHTASPVLSLSLGCDAVFLLGGEERGVAPLALRLRSGDALLMGGDSRLAVHGVAAVVGDTAPVDALFPAGEGGGVGGDDGAPGDAAEEAAFAAWIATHRINLNLRQVWADPPGAVLGAGIAFSPV